MASLSFFHSCVLILIASLLIIPISCNGEFLQHKKHVALFIFGDSLFDPGNNDYISTNSQGKANFWPYGESFFKYPTGRFSDGLVVPDFIAEYAKLPLWKPYLRSGTHRFTDGANFASAGAGVLVETHPGTIHLRMQLSYFKNVTNLLRQKLGNAKAKKLLMTAVYLFSIGGNDYFSLFRTNSHVLPSYQRQYVGMVIGNLTNVLEEIYQIGGRKIAFQNAGPLGCLPGSRATTGSNGDCAKGPSTIAKQHNIALSEVLKKFESQLPGFKYSIFDYYSSLGKRTNHPEKFGFKEGKSGCCGSGLYRGINSCGGKRGIKDYELCSNPSEYVWFDAAHTTQSCNQQLAQLMWNGPPNVTGPYNVKQLFETA